MNSKEAVSLILGIGLPKGSFLAVGGTVLALNGIRPCADVDLLLNSDGEKHINDMGWVKSSGRASGSVYRKDLIEVYTDLCVSDAYQPDFESLYLRADYVDGIPAMSLQDLIAFKTALGRKKDFDDIVLIKAHLG